MPAPAKGPRLGGSPAHERLMLANLATALFEHGRITTTETKAKRLRPYAEKLITFGKRGDLHARRQVLKVLRDKTVVNELFAEIGPRYAGRPGGYTRILKTGNRKGDNAPMAIIELVEPLTTAQQAVGEAERALGTRFAGRRPVSAATAESAAELAGESATAAAVASDAPAAQDDATESGAGMADAASEVTQAAADEPAAEEPAADESVAAADAADTALADVEATEADAAGADLASQPPIADQADGGQAPGQPNNSGGATK